jgi:hypothetical protein
MTCVRGAILSKSSVHRAQFSTGNRCNARQSAFVCRGAVRISGAILVVAIAALLSACSHGGPAERGTADIIVPAGDVAGELSWSPDRRCAAVVLSNKEGHSPMTTTRVAIVEPGVAGYREVRLPEPNARFSTTLEKWEAPGVLRVHAATLDGEISARYSCSSRKLEIIP